MRATFIVLFTDFEKQRVVDEFADVGAFGVVDGVGIAERGVLRYVDVMGFVEGGEGVLLQVLCESYLLAHPLSNLLATRRCDNL